MRKSSFEELVRQAVTNIPLDFRLIMQNVDVQVRNNPTLRQLRKALLAPGQELLGIYEVVSPSRKKENNTALRDKVTIFQSSIENMCSSDEEILHVIQKTVIHEVAHFFGITEVELEAWGVV
mgnify:CR=1 FL=1